MVFLLFVVTALRIGPRRRSAIAAAWLGAKLYCDACAARFLPCWNQHGVRNDPLNGSNRNRENDRMRHPLDAVSEQQLAERAVAVVRQIAAAYHAGLVAFDTADE